MIACISYSDGAYPGCARAPQKIIDQLKGLWGNSSNRKITLPLILQANITEIPRAKVYIGGDHTITYYVLKELRKHFSAIGVLIFDAHPDVFSAFPSPTHEDYLHFLLEEKVLAPEQVILVGIRASHPDEIRYLQERHIPFFSYPLGDIESVADTITEFLRKFPAAYISFDMDVLDPAFAPGVSYVEPCGMSSSELWYFVSRLKRLSNLNGIDLVEVNPEFDIRDVTAKLAAKIVAEFL